MLPDLDIGVCPDCDESSAFQTLSFDHFMFSAASENPDERSIDLNTNVKSPDQGLHHIRFYDD